MGLHLKIDLNMPYFGSRLKITRSDGSQNVIISVAGHVRGVTSAISETTEPISTNKSALWLSRVGSVLIPGTTSLDMLLRTAEPSFLHLSNVCAICVFQSVVCICTL